ncbi:MAG: Ppx/GppA phosphatase family protein [Acidaminococcaceae bacterium]|nr:Ppx/GppA phosphatase family protein [Acidaminococcaceae bacterium]
MQRIAIIDIGSNSARLVITHIYKNGAYNMVYNQKEALRLSQKVDSRNMLTQEAFDSAIETMKNFVHMCQIYKTDKTIAVATAAIRNANNGAQLVNKIAEECGVQLHIISGSTEAFVSYIGVINTINIKSGIIFDLGGGSTELILFKNREIVESVSLPFGAVNTTGMFNTKDSMPANVYSELSFFLSSRLEKYPWLKQKNLPLIGVGGTARTFAKIIQRAKKYPATKLHNYSYTTRTFFRFFNMLRKTNFEQRKKISGLSSERSDIILAGSSIISCLAEITGSRKIITSGCGLREGLFLDYYAKSHNTPLFAKNILQTSTENFLKLYTADTTHAKHITAMAMKMFTRWNQLHKLPKDYRKLLKTAALLHDIGITINFYSHARHSAYMIQNAQIFGLTHKEQVLAAAVAGWHHGVSKNYFKDRFYKEMIKDNMWNAVTKLSLLLMLAESLDYSQTQQITSIEPSLQNRTAFLKLYSSGNPWLETAQLKSKVPLFKKIFGAELKFEILPHSE